jgi:hypothetical protein
VYISAIAVPLTVHGNARSNPYIGPRLIGKVVAADLSAGPPANTSVLMQMLAEPSDLSAGRAIEVHFIGIKMAAIERH